MDNEQLAIAIKQGKTEYTAELWQNTYRLIYMLVTEYYNKLVARCQSCGATLDDLKQESYIAFVRMIKAYDPEKEFKFTTYAKYHVKAVVLNMLGFRTNDKKRPLNESSSLNEPVPGFDDEEKTIIDTLEDTTAVEGFESAEDDILNAELKKALDVVMDEYLTERQHDIIVGRFYNNKTYSALGKENNVSHERIRQEELKAIQIMRKAQELNRFRDEYISDHSYFFTSLGSFRDRLGSSQELITERFERLKELKARELNRLYGL